MRPHLHRGLQVAWLDELQEAGRPALVRVQRKPEALKAWADLTDAWRRLEPHVLRELLRSLPRIVVTLTKAMEARRQKSGASV